MSSQEHKSRALMEVSLTSASYLVTGLLRDSVGPTCLVMFVCLFVLLQVWTFLVKAKETFLIACSARQEVPPSYLHAAVNQ